FNQVMALGDPDGFNAPSIGSEDIAFLQYTGGTTGVAKGATLTHANIVANIMQVHAWLESGLPKDNNIVITPLPLYHIFSLTVNCFILFSAGALNVLITNPRDIPGFIKELNNWKFTCITGVNTLFRGLLNHPDFKNVDFSSLKVAVGGGMAVQKPVADQWVQTTKVPLVEGYGLTETSPCACVNPLNIKGFTGHIGLPLPSTEVSIKDDQENNLPLGEVGEIAIKGPQVMRGYWRRQEETDKVMSKDGYFKSGDMGFMDEKGYVKLVDRKKDMILVSGFNVYPNEIEEVVCQHPKVLEAAAVGVHSDKSGQAVKLFIVKKDTSLTEDEVKDHCRENLTGYKNPKFIEFRDDLPKSNVGKILRKDLRENA
ncbi:MAG: AMP-binding protein, partial [Halobacteriovoraceae bacterium]|nr:AMP-binding protein [Halobacteriovoraceae bacterium]